MNFNDVKETIPFAFDPITREAFFAGFTIALTIGFAAGFISCRFLYLMIRGAWIVFRDRLAAGRAERERKERECQENRKRFAELRRQKKAEQKAAETRKKLDADFAEFQKQCRTLGLVDDYNEVHDREGLHYCVSCFKKGKIYRLYRDGEISRCPKCPEQYPPYEE